jgi:hypothetical protein
MGGRARISPTSLWVREDVGEIREGLLFPALVARHAKRFHLHWPEAAESCMEPSRALEHGLGVPNLGRLLKALLRVFWGGKRGPGGVCHQVRSPCGGGCRSRRESSTYSGLTHASPHNADIVRLLLLTSSHVLILWRCLIDGHRLFQPGHSVNREMSGKL